MSRLSLLVILILSLAAPPAKAQDIDQLNKQVLRLYNEGRFQEATPLQQQLVGLLEQKYGSGSVQMASGLNNLAELYVKQGRPADALPLYRRALAIRQNQLGPDHPDTVKSQTRLGELLESQRSSTAPPPPQPQLQRAAPQQPRPNPINEDMQRAGSLNQQALQLSQNGKAAEALPLAKQVLAIFQKDLPADHPTLAIGYGNLAQIHQRLGQYDEALPLFQKALEILRQHKDSSPADQGYMLANIADIHAQKKEWPAAEDYYKRSLPFLEKSLKADDPNLKRVLNNLAQIYRMQGKVPDLDPLLKGRIDPTPVALPGKRLDKDEAKLLKPEDVERQSQLEHLLFEQTDQRKYPEALITAQELQTRLENMYGANSLAVALNLDRLANLYRLMGREKEAAPLSQLSQSIRDNASATDRSVVEH